MSTLLVNEILAPSPKIIMRRALMILAFCLASALLAWQMRPTIEVQSFDDQKLNSLIPETFGDWRVDKSIVPVLPDPSTLAYIDQIYSDTLARTYVNNRGERVMLSLAYGRRQNDTMRVHRPEGCYLGQGFGVRRVGERTINIAGQPQKVMQLEATLGLRQEPITYWMVVGGIHAVDQTQAKLAQLRFGLRGYIPDGLLFRVSNITRETEAGFKLQESFIRELISEVPVTVRAGLLGI